MGLVINLRRARDASSKTVSCPDPQSYLFHLERRAGADNWLHRRPGVGLGSAGNLDGSHRRADDRDHRCPGGGDGSERHHGRPHYRAGTREADGNFRPNIPGGKGGRGKGGHSSSDGRNGHRHRSRGDAKGTSSSCSSTDTNNRATNSDITGVNGKKQVVPLPVDAASSRMFWPPGLVR